jgi:beta-aspartyl-peptidase (threonine type)
VALDAFGHLAAATSTGGLAGKPIGRIGDSAIIGAGTYASDASCAVSGTGQGEYFIRATVARDIAALMEYGDKNLAEAARLVVHGRLSALGGRGGIIALDRTGHLAIDFSTDVMHRGAVSAGSAPWTAVRADDALPADRERP